MCVCVCVCGHVQRELSFFFFLRLERVKSRLKSRGMMWPLRFQDFFQNLPKKSSLLSELQRSANVPRNLFREKIQGGFRSAIHDFTNFQSPLDATKNRNWCCPIIMYYNPSITILEERFENVSDRVLLIVRSQKRENVPPNLPNTSCRLLRRV